MPEILLRPAEAGDIAALAAFEPEYSTEQVWQMDLFTDETSQVQLSFRRQRLPRVVRAETSRRPEDLLKDWQERPGLLLATLEGRPAGYISLGLGPAPATAWVTELTVLQELRGRGIGSALALAGLEWAAGHGCERLVVEVQPKNYPAICLAQKLGFAFAGYQDHYYANGDTALFFGRGVR